MIVLLQSLQKTSRLLARVSGSTRISRLFRLQHGHDIHPFFTASLAEFCTFFNTFHPPF